MATQCNPPAFEFQGLFGREVVARFDGGPVSSDGGGLLLREVDDRFRFIEQFARCFTDHRDPEAIEHPLVDLLKQRIFGLCLGYEDLIDHDRLRNDPLLAVLVGKAEHLAKGPNPRFVVTSLAIETFDAATLYEQEYCGRGNMENRIKEQQLSLFADRTSCHTLRANQLRLAFSTVAYVVLRALREFGLADTPLATAQADTIRVRLLKIGAVIRVTVRKVWIALSESYPWQELFATVYARLTAWRGVPQPSTG